MAGPLDDVILGAHERAKQRAAERGEEPPSLGSFVDSQARGLEGQGQPEKARKLRDFLNQSQAVELPTRAREAAQAHETAVLQDVRRSNPFAFNPANMTPRPGAQAAELEQARAEKEEAAGRGGPAPVAAGAPLPYSNVDPSRMVDLLEAAGVKTQGMLEPAVRKRFYEQFGEQVQTDDAAESVAQHLWRTKAQNVQAEEAEGAEKRGEPINVQDFTKVGFGEHGSSTERAKSYVRDVEAQRQARAADRAATNPLGTALRENLLAPTMEAGAAIGSMFRETPVSGSDVATVLTGGGLERIQDDEAKAVIAHAMETPTLSVVRGIVRGYADLGPLVGFTRGATTALAAMKVPAQVAVPLGRSLGMGVWSGLVTNGTAPDRLQAALGGALMAQVAHGVANSAPLQAVVSKLPGHAANAVTEAIGFLAGDYVARGGDMSLEDAVHALVLGAAQGGMNPTGPRERNAQQLDAARAIVREAFSRNEVMRVTKGGMVLREPGTTPTPDEAAAAAMTARRGGGGAPVLDRGGTPVTTPDGQPIRQNGIIREGWGTTAIPRRRMLARQAGMGVTSGDTPVPQPQQDAARPRLALPGAVQHETRWQQDPRMGEAVAAERRRLEEPPPPPPPPPPPLPTDSRGQRVLRRGVSPDAIDAFAERAIRAGAGTQVDLRRVLESRFQIPTDAATESFARLWRAGKITTEQAESLGVHVQGPPKAQPRTEPQFAPDGYGEPFQVPQGLTGYQRLVRTFRREQRVDLRSASPRRAEEHLARLDRLRGTLKASWEQLPPAARERALRQHRTGLDYEAAGKPPPSAPPAEETAPKGSPSPRPDEGAAPAQAPVAATETPAAATPAPVDGTSAPAAATSAPRRRILRDPAHVKATERAAALRQEKQELQTEKRNLQKDAWEDARSGLPNANAWDRMTSRWEKGEDGTPKAPEGKLVLTQDMGEFKTLNDKHGHATGDAALKLVGDRMKQAAEAAGVDIKPRDLFDRITKGDAPVDEAAARTGGDEFSAFGTRAQIERMAEFNRNRGPVKVPLPDGTFHEIHIDLGYGETVGKADAAARAAKASRKKAAGIGTREQEAAKAAAAPAPAAPEAPRRILGRSGTTKAEDPELERLKKVAREAEDAESRTTPGTPEFKEAAKAMLEARAAVREHLAAAGAESEPATPGKGLDKPGSGMTPEERAAKIADMGETPKADEPPAPEAPAPAGEPSPEAVKRWENRWDRVGKAEDHLLPGVNGKALPRGELPAAIKAAENLRDESRRRQAAENARVGRRSQAARHLDTARRWDRVIDKLKLRLKQHEDRMSKPAAQPAEPEAPVAKPAESPPEKAAEAPAAKGTWQDLRASDGSLMSSTSFDSTGHEVVIRPTLGDKFTVHRANDTGPAAVARDPMKDASGNTATFGTLAEAKAFAEKALTIPAQKPMTEPPAKSSKEEPPAPAAEPKPKKEKKPAAEPAPAADEPDDLTKPQTKEQVPLPDDTPSASWKAYHKRILDTLPKPTSGTVEVPVTSGKETRRAEIYGDWALVPADVERPALAEGEKPDPDLVLVGNKGTKWNVTHVGSGLAAGPSMSRADAREYVARLIATKADFRSRGPENRPSDDALKAAKLALGEMKQRLGLVGQVGTSRLVPLRGLPFSAKRRTASFDESGTMKVDAESLPEEAVPGWSSGDKRDPRGFLEQMARVGWNGKLDVVEGPLKVTSYKPPRNGEKKGEVDRENESPRYLLWRDPTLGVEIRLFPEALGFKAADLAGGKRLDFDLDSLGIKRPSGSSMGKNLSPDTSFAATLEELAKDGAEVVWDVNDPVRAKELANPVTLASPEPLLATESMDRLPEAMVDVGTDPLLEAPAPHNGFKVDMPPLPHGPTGEWEGKRVPAHRVIRAFQRMIGKIPIRSMRRSDRLHNVAAGYFNVRSELIRVREANDLPTVAHEAGHAIEKIIWWNEQGNPSFLPNTTGPVNAELVTLGKMLYGPKIPNGGYAREGFAEFIRGWMFGLPKVGKHSPAVEAWFEGTFLKQNPKLAKLLHAAKHTAGQFMAQGRENAYTAAIVRKGTHAPGRFRRLLKTANTRMIEAGDVLSDMGTAAEIRLGRKLAPSEDPFAVLTGLRLTHSARARYMVEHGMIDVQGNLRGPSLKEATSIVAEHGKQRGWTKQQTIDRFTLYLWGRRAVERILAKGKNPGMSLIDARALVKEYDSPEFQLAAAKVYKWNRQILGYAVSGGALSAREAQRILHGSSSYIPLQRAMDSLSAGEVSRAVQGGTPLQRFKGSGEAIRDPFAVMAENAEKMVRWTHESMVRRAVIRLSGVEGMGRFVDKIDRDVESNSVALEKIRKQLEDAGADLSGADADAILNFFTPMRTTPRGKPIIQDRDPQTGKVSWYEVDPNLYEALHGLDVTRLPKWIDASFGRAARTLRLGTTGLRATFSLVTNPLRDTATGFLQSKTTDNPLRYLGNQVRATANEALKVFGKDNPYSDLFKRLGGEMARPLGLDTHETQRGVNELFAGKGFGGRVVKVIRNPIDHLRDLLQIPESATRVAELRRMAGDVGYKPGGPISTDQMLQMLIAAKRVTVDFTAAGTWARAINQVIPFFNASLQGARSFGRSVKERPLATFLKALTTRTIPALMLWNLHKDEDWYRDMPWREKFSHFWISGSKTELVGVPRVYDWDNAFSVLPEAIVDSIYRKDPEALKEWMGNVFSSSPLQYLPWSPTEGFRPGILAESPISGELVEQLWNRDTFTGQKIVPEGERRMKATEQVAPFTSGIARFLGNTLKWSPRRIDHAIRGFTGGLVHDSADLVDWVVKKATGDDPGLGFRGPSRGEFKDVPIIGSGLGRRGGKEGWGSIAVERLYDAIDKAAEREESKESPETPQERLRRMSLEDAGRVVKWLRTLQGQSSTQEERQAIQREIRSIARRATAEGPPRRFLGEAKQAEQRARAATSPSGGSRRILGPRR